MKKAFLLIGSLLFFMAQQVAEQEKPEDFFIGNGILKLLARQTEMPNSC